MCDDHVDACDESTHDGGTHEGATHDDGLSRRRFMQSMAGLAVAGSLPGSHAALTPTTVADALDAGTAAKMAARAAGRDVGLGGLPAYSMALHVHSSFSEQDGSMDAQLYQAATNAVDVLWWTDHDARMESLGYRKTVHFTSLTAEAGASGEGGPWKWTKKTKGTLVTASSSGGIVTNPSSPLDPTAGGALHVQCKSKTTAPATLGYFANCHPGGDNYKDNLSGQTLKFEVMAATAWSRGYIEFAVTSSFHTATMGRPAGDYSISYRFAPGGTASRSVSGITGVVTTPVQAGAWTSVTINPAQDIAGFWPDMDVRDFALFAITVNAVSTGDVVSGYVDYLRFTRSLSGTVHFDMQQDMMTALAPRYPDVGQYQGLEVSWQLPHINWFGPNVTLPDYSNVKAYKSFVQNSVIPRIHAAGGLASYNHPYGYAEGTLLPESQQLSMQTATAKTLLGNRAMGVDLIEVGYNVRQGVGFDHHVGLWDVMSRNAVFLTAEGANDDHYGQDWLGIVNNFFTTAWAASTAQSDLLAALRAGRAWCAPLAVYRGSLDLVADNVCPMGSVSVSSVSSRSLRVLATDLPAGAKVQVVRGPVDYAGTADATPGTTVIAQLAATDLDSAGTATVTVDTSAGAFLRTQVVNAAGATIAVSNPVWLLRAAPPGGIPPARAA
jgi:hypothetical protein